VELHRRVAGALEQLHQVGRVPAAEVARHWLASGPASVEGALRTSALAGDEALARLGPDEARGWYDTALELLKRSPEPRDAQRCELLIRRGEAERHAGDLRFRDTLLDAAALALQIGEDRLLISAALANTRGMQSETGVVDAARVRTLDAALRAIGEADSPARAQLLAMRAAELMYSGDWTNRVSMSDEALAMARRVDDPAALSAVLNMRFVTLLAPRTLAERSANAVEATAVAERLDDPLAHFFACHWRTYTCIEAADVLGARTWATRGREIAERFQQPTALWLSCTDQANLAIIAGEFDRAGALADEALKIGRSSEPDAVTCHAAQRASIAFESGQLPTLIPAIEHAVQVTPGVPGFRAVLALAYITADRHDEARDLLAAQTDFAAVPYDVAWLAVLCIYAQVSAALDEVLPAQRLYELLSPWREQIAFPAFGVWGPVELYLGSLARTMAENDLAQQHFLAASQAARRAEAPRWQERAARELAGLPAGAK
jgi:hypothetical protein